MSNETDKQNKQKVIESFDKIADIENTKNTENERRRWNHNNHYYSKMLDLVTRKNSTILDIGCGKGDFVTDAAKRGFFATGIDFSPEMIKRAQQNTDKIYEIEIKNACSFICGDAYDILPTFKQQSFDAAFSFATMHHMDYLKLVPVLQPLIKPRGFFGVVDIPKNSTVTDYLTDLAAIPTNIVMNRIRNGKTEKNEQSYEE
ncbi:MAG: class I SAM-dependent methyltransferase, partial [Oscillospiraceae bacterium]|nr:class I SAM-dependent methyltransferase [Oscillospiraceae bacterium]